MLVTSPRRMGQGTETTGPSGAVLKGNRLDIDTGRGVTVVGVLRVIDHGPYVVNRVLVPAWTEVRVQQ
jgi:hypothetical protein